MIENFHLLKAGHCKQLERISLKSGKWKIIDFPALFSVMHHNKNGYLLFDTGYSDDFFKSTAKFPYSIYSSITPVTLGKTESAKYQLKALNIAASNITNIFISHFHADHISGLKDFPKANFICSNDEYQYYKNLNKISALSKAFLSSLIPQDFEIRTRFIENCKKINIEKDLSPFITGYDLFEDKSLIAISLPGHSRSHYGLLINSENNRYFMIGDSCWSCEAYLNNIPPSKLSSFIFDNWKIYLKTLDMLNQLALKQPDLRIIPSHCNHSFEKWGHNL